jgi:hypothetical protein
MADPLFCSFLLAVLCLALALIQSLLAMADSASPASATPPLRRVPTWPCVTSRCYACI